MPDHLLEETANAVSILITNTDTDVRGNMLLRVAEILSKKSQHYTANLIADAARKYGINGDYNDKS